MSILTNIEDTLNEGSLHIIKNKLFEKLYNDAAGLSLIDPHNHYGHYGHNYFIGYDGYKNNILNYARNSIRELTLYDLINEFELCADDIELFCKSEYINKIQENFVYNSDFGLSIQTNLDNAIYYLNNKKQVEKNYIKYINKKINLNFIENNYNIFLYNLNKAILSINLYVSDKFISELNDYFKEK